jgi:hypothetical protein
MVAVGNAVTNEKRWIGDIYGATVGYVFYVEYPNGDGSISVGRRDGTGAVKFSTKRITGQSRVSLYPRTDDSSHNNSDPVGHIDFDVETNVALNGKWALNDGAEGIIQLQIASQPRAAAEQAALMPLQLWNKEIPLGAITLYRSDLTRVIAELESHIPEPRRTTIRATEDEQVIIMPAAPIWHGKTCRTV